MTAKANITAILTNGKKIQVSLASDPGQVMEQGQEGDVEQPTWT